MTRTALRAFVTAALAATAGCHHAAPAPTKPAAKPGPDAAPPDLGAAQEPDAAPPAPPAHVTFDPQPWPTGAKIKMWRTAKLADMPGRDDVVQKDTLAFTVTGAAAGGGVVVSVGPDCTAVIAHGTARVTGNCDGDATDVAYKLDLAAQLLENGRGTITVGDVAPGFARPLVAYFRLQDAGAILDARVAGADDGGAKYAAHLQVDGLMLRPDLHVSGVLDGAIMVDVHALGVVGGLAAARVTVQPDPTSERTVRGSLSLDFGVQPQ